MQAIKIYLAEKRKYRQQATHVRLQTLPEAWHRLQDFEEVKLQPGAAIDFRSTDSTCCFILPLVGKITVSTAESKVIDVGEIYYVGPQAQPGHIANNYKTEWVSFLMWRIRDAYPQNNMCAEFDLEREKNQLFQIMGNLNPASVTIRLGMFEGRSSGILRTPDAQHFIVVIAGAFEVQNRLLQQGDALQIPDCAHLEFEALSTNAILLVISQT
ncbi:MAG: hypothetical protein J0L66_14455 [Cytophagales bacterium]|nr:hypothetical protein [Cytophagales bacterium]